MKINGSLVIDRHNERELLIYLPPSYQNTDLYYPTIYIHDRGDLFDPKKSDALQKIESMFHVNELPELIFIGVASLDRNDEYTPFVDQNLWEPSKNFGGNGSRYARYLAMELKPYIDGKYRTLPNASNTGIIGKSFGGLISIYSAFQQPYIFGKVGSISGSFWFKGIVEYICKTEFQNPKRRIYMDVGSEEGINRKTLQKNMVPNNKEVSQILIMKGVPENEFRFVLDEGGLHSPKYFNSRFPYALKWLFHNS